MFHFIFNGTANLYKEKKELIRQIKNAEDTVEAMKIARKNLLKFKSSFEEGLDKA